MRAAGVSSRPVSAALDGEVAIDDEQLRSRAVATPSIDRPCSVAEPLCVGDVVVSNRYKWARQVRAIRGGDVTYQCYDIENVSPLDSPTRCSIGRLYEWADRYATSDEIARLPQLPPVSKLTSIEILQTK
jgi:hypothetical protein